MSSPRDESAQLDNTTTRENLLDFVESFPQGPSSDLPGTPAPIVVEMAPMNPVRSRTLARLNRPRFFRNQAMRNCSGTLSTPLQSIAIFIKKCQQKQLSNRARQLRAKEGVCAIKARPFVSQDKKEIVGLPSHFDVGLMAELTDDDEFLGPMKQAIRDNDVQNFSKQGLYIAQFWTVSSAVDNCILIDNKLGIPFNLR